MSKIGKKVVISYLIIVIFSVGISVSITKNSFSSTYNQQIIRNLVADADTYSAQIQANLTTQIALEQLPPTSSMLGAVINSLDLWFNPYSFSNNRIIIYDPDNAPRYISWKLGQDLRELQIEPSNYFIQRRGITDPRSNQTIGYLDVLAPKEKLGVANTLINRAAFFGAAISMALAMLLALFFERNLISPINKLRRNIANFSIEGNNTWEEIGTKDEIADLNQEFKKMTNNLMRYDSKQKEFFQNTSHELKTPLMSIQGYAEAIKYGIMPEEDISNALDIIVDETNRLTDTVNSIVYMSRLENDREKALSGRKQTIEIHEFIDEVLSRFQIVAEERGLHLENCTQNEVYYRIEEEHLYKMVSNLISNAIRYAQTTVWAGACLKEEGLCIGVKDDGKGFNENEIDKVFDRFYKGEKGNSGLGLSIVRSTALLYGGSITAVNRESGGARVEVCLPRQKDDPRIMERNGILPLAAERNGSEMARRGEKP